MTTGFVDLSAPQATAPEAATAPAEATSPALDRSAVIRQVAGVILSVVGILLLSLVVYLYAFTPLTHSRDQQKLLQSLTTSSNPATSQGQFALINGKVPAEGSAVAILHIPAIGLSQVVVQGTSAADLQAGPGHMPGTALPGTPGNAVIAGKRVTFGGPFAHIGSLHRGQPIRVIDGLGTFTYRVVSVRSVPSGRADVVSQTSTNRLTLVTSNSSLVTSGRLVVAAKLVGLPVAPPSALPGVIPSGELGLSGDPSAGGSILFWSEMLLLVAGFTAFALWRWRRPWPTYLLAAPVLLACGLFAAESIARWLPATL